ncbi:MAG: 16S rRNA (adenine(1518)-N(6)/adenine(1519)-N(6))-dimethyltransferase RsmA [Limisphaerales bacterium]
MRELLNAEGVQLTRSLGQNFLHDANQLRRIVAAAELTPGARVLEIGPGLGPLTELLLAAGARVLAIEADVRMVTLLNRRLGQPAGLELIHADALEWLRENPRDWSGWRVVSNLPYSAGSPIVVELARAPVPPDRVVVTLQREVVDRLRAEPGAPDYGLLTLLVRAVYARGGWFKIPASCFFPAPDVESACVTFHRRIPPTLTAEELARFDHLVKLAFSQRRKMLGKLLRAAWTEAEVNASCEFAGIAPTVRAEEVSLDALVWLLRTLPTVAQRPPARKSSRRA